MTHSPKNFLITGGAGFIGANFIDYLLKNYDDLTVINFDALTYAANLSYLSSWQQDNRYRFIQGDILDNKLVTKTLLAHDIDTIVHFAAESHVDRSIADPAVFVRTNVLGTQTLMQAAREVWTRQHKNNVRFHHISTDEVYGSLNFQDAAFTEEHSLSPRSPYSASKAGSDHVVMSYYHTYGMPVTLSRCSNNFGPYQHAEKFIPTVIRNCIQQTAIPIYGSGKNIRDWIYVEDHCRGVDTIIRHGNVGECYNLGGNNEWDNLALAHKICELFDEITPENKPHQRLLRFVNDRLGHDLRYAIDASKAKRTLDWQPTEKFEFYLKNTVAFYRQQYMAVKKPILKDMIYT